MPERYHRPVELRHLRFFVTVAEELHFSRAAERLRTSQPYVTRQIHDLEREIGVPLLSRTKRRVELTEAGRAFYQEARRAVEQTERSVQAAQKVARGERGHLSVGFANAELIPDVLRAFRQRYPEVELEVQELTTAEQVRALRDGRLHAGILVPGVEDELLCIEIIREEPLVAVLPESHALLRERSVPLQALASESFILCPYRLNPHVYERILALCKGAGFTPRVVEEASPKQTILGLVAAGLGVSLVAASVQQSRRTGVAYRPLRGIHPTVEVAVAWRKDEKSPALQVFLSVVREFARTPIPAKRLAS